MMRGIRGAIQVARNDRDSILDSAKELMSALIHSNGVKEQHVSAVFFTVTPDLTAAFPAGVRMAIGWNLVPFLCSQEIPVPGSMERVLRALILLETDLSQEQIHHCYLGETASLRPDLTNKVNDERRSL